METKVIQLPLKKKAKDNATQFVEATVARPTLERMQQHNEHQNMILGLNEAQVTMLGKYREAQKTVVSLEASTFGETDKKELEKLDIAKKRAESFLSRANALKADMYEIMWKRTQVVVELGTNAEGKAVKFEDIDWKQCEGPVLNEASDFFFKSTLPSQTESSS